MASLKYLDSLQMLITTLLVNVFFFSSHSNTLKVLSRSHSCLSFSGSCSCRKALRIVAVGSILDAHWQHLHWDFIQLSTMQANQITRHAFFSKSKMCLGFLLWFLLSRHDASESAPTIAICIHECSVETSVPCGFLWNPVKIIMGWSGISCCSTFKFLHSQLSLKNTLFWVSI